MNAYDKGIVENLKEEFFATPKEIYARTLEFPSQQHDMDKISLLPTRTIINSDSAKFNKNY